MWKKQTFPFLLNTKNLISNLNRRNYIVPALILLFLIGLSASGLAQCAMCKQAAASTLEKNPGSLARSLNSGILYLMVVPYLMLMFIFRKQLKVLFLKLKHKFSHS